MYTRIQFWKFTELSLYTLFDLKVNFKPHQALQQGNLPPLGITELEATDTLMDETTWYLDLFLLLEPKNYS